MTASMKVNKVDMGSQGGGQGGKGDGKGGVQGGKGGSQVRKDRLIKAENISEFASRVGKGRSRSVAEIQAACNGVKVFVDRQIDDVLASQSLVMRG